MKSKKSYKAPQIKSEIIQVGVFGDYGSNDCDFSPINFINPFFRLCCS